MKTMNGITSELLAKKAKRNWRTRCGAFLLAFLTSWYGGHAAADVILTVSGDALGSTAYPPVYDFTTTNGVGEAGPEAHTQFRWDSNEANGYNNLNNLYRGITVNVALNPQSDPATIETRTLHSGGGTGVQVNTLNFTSGTTSSTVRFTESLAWNRGDITVDATASGTIQGTNNSSVVLELYNHLQVLGTLNITPITGDYTNSLVRVTGGSNSGKINLDGGQFEIATNNFGGGGTIEINQWGNLTLSATSITQDIIGNYNVNDISRTRGQILVTTGYELNPVNISGHVSNSVSFDGGGVARLSANNSGDAGNAALTSLYIRNQSAYSGTQVLISDQNNIGNASVFLSENGALSKAAGSNLTIGNSVQIGVPMGSGLSGTLNSLMAGTAVSWQSDADQLLDGGNRFTITGEIASYLPGATININQSTYGNGTVVLTNSGNGSNYFGDYVIHRGTLEVAGQSSLGGNNNTTRYKVYIGSDTTMGERAVFRVTGNANATQTIDHWISLHGQNSFYEVFTTSGEGAGVNNVNMADANRFKVIQSGQIIGSGDLNKTGDGTLVLNVFNDYSGDTNIWHGVLSVTDANNINNATNAKIRIGGQPLMEDNKFRPVFETNVTDRSNGTIIINAGVVVNQTNSIIRTAGVGNETILTNTVTTESVPGDAGVQPPYPAILSKDGAGTLTLQGLGQWGRYGAGELKINQGTVKFSRQDNLTTGDITIGTNWLTYKDLEKTDQDGKSITYKAVLQLEDNSTVGLSNRIILASPAPGNSDPAESGSYLDVGTNSILSLTSAVIETVAGSDLNKIGKGELILNSVDNSYTGWTNVYNGTFTLTQADSLSKSKGVDLVDEGTIFNMSQEGASQTLKGLRGGTDPNYMTADEYRDMLGTHDDPSEWTRQVLIGDNTLTLDLQNFKSDDQYNTSTESVFRGHIVGTGTLVKKGLTASTFLSGFEGFSGAFDIQTGTLGILTDTTITGLSGKAGTYLDVLNHTLTIDIGSAQTYSGYIVSSDPALPYTDDTGRPHLIKDGAGTLTAGFYERLSNNYFLGDLTIKQGNIVSTTEYHMEGGSNLTFHVNSDYTGSVTPIILDVGGNGKEKAVFSKGGESGTEMTNVSVVFGEATTGWKTPAGSLTVAKILGNEQSNYEGLRSITDTDSLYHAVVLAPEYGTNRYDMNINVNVTGFSGVGNTFNTRAVGSNLDAIRVTDLTGHGLAPLIQDLWAAGSDVTADNREERLKLVRGIFQQLSGDTIANAMFMGLDKPWQRAFDRLNLDSQMVYLTPPQGGKPGAIANMRNIWFTPSVQSLTMRSDGNARRAGIDRPGYQVGFDKRVAQNTSVGFVLGYSSPKLHQGDDRVEASDFQFGLYGGSMIGSYVELKGFIGFGHQNFKSNRTIYLPGDSIVSDGLGGYRPIGGNQRTMSSHGRFDGDTFNFSFEVSRPLFLGFAILRPTIGLDSEHAFRYGFTETGDASSMSFKRASLSRTRARFGLGLETCSFERAIFTGRLGYSALLGGNDYATVEGQFINSFAPNQKIRSVAVGTSYFEAGVGTRIFMNPAKTLVLVGSYDASIADRWAEHQAVVGFKYTY